jgi:anti-anti-sigma factor
MAVPQGIVRVRQQEGTVTFQVEGRSTVTQSLSFRRCAEQCLENGATAVRVDLRRCVYMDSTFIGTLLFLMRAMDRQCQNGFTLVAPAPECLQILQQMKMDRVFPINSDADPGPDSWTQLPTNPDDPCMFKRNVVQDHEELATLPGPAGEPFREVVRCLARERETEKAR